MSQTAKIIQFKQENRVEDSDNDNIVTGGYIRLYRSLQDSSFSNKAEYVSTWVHMLMLATHKSRKTMMGKTSVHLLAGQFVSGRKALAITVGTSEQSMRTIISFFEQEGMISKSSNRNGTVFSVLNFGTFQAKKINQPSTNINNQQINQPEATDLKGSSDIATKVSTNTQPSKSTTTQENNKTKKIIKPIVSTDVVTTPNKTIPDYSDEFIWLWDNRPRRQGSDSKKKVFQCCKARIKQGFTWREMAEGMNRYRDYCQATGKLNTEYTMQMTRFFGSEEQFKEEWNYETATANQSVFANQPKKLSTVDRQHAAAAEYLARLNGEQGNQNENGGVVAAYE